MTGQASGSTTAMARPRRPDVSAWVYVLFFCSGISGLMYQVVWVRMLGTVLGNTVFASATILASFMAGLALGSFLASRFVDRLRRPLLFYAMLEVGVGLAAALSLGLARWPAPIYQAIYNLAGQSRLWLTVGQVVVSTLALLIPTALMGATLPALTAYATRGRPGYARSVGYLYAINTLGAMFGTLVSGFVLIGAVGQTATIMMGVALNLLVGLAALMMSRSSDDLDPGGSTHADLPEPAGDGEAIHYGPATRQTVLLCFAASGLVVVAFEVVWTRMLLLFQGTSIYSFSAMLAVVLGGIGLGSLIGGKVASRSRDPLTLLARLEMGMSLTALVGLAMIVRLFSPESMTRYFGQGTVTGTALLALLFRDLFLSPLVIVGPTALLSGLAFPVAARCCRAARGPGWSVGTLYAWNTVGCIVGAIMGGFVLIPLCGSSNAGVALGLASALIGLVLLLPAMHARQSPRQLIVEGCLALLIVLMIGQVGNPYRKVLETIIHKQYSRGATIYAYDEDATAATTAFGSADGNPLRKQLYVNGFGMTLLVTPTKLMAHLPLWLADRPRDALVICMGMGTTFRSMTRHPDVQATVVEIVPAVPTFFRYYHADAAEVLAQPNAHVAVDDGRNFVSMRANKYDVITLDPAPPLYSAGTVNLYTREFFALCKSHLREDGVLCLWVPPWRQSEVDMICRTFLDVFDHATVWSPRLDFPGVMLIGSLKPIEGIRQRIEAGFTDRFAVADLTEWDKEFDSPAKVMQCYLCDGAQLRTLFADTPVISDDHPWTEFPLWRIGDSAGSDRMDGNGLFERLKARFGQLPAPPP